MVKHRTLSGAEVTDEEWVTFPGGELEGRRPKTLCPKCRETSRHAGGGSGPRTLCFECYRTDATRERALTAARNLFTGSEERFQDALPFEPINRARLNRLRAERSTARAALRAGTGRFVDKRRHAQIAARHALQQIAAGLHDHGAVREDVLRAMRSAAHAAELQLPDAWLPFVVSR
jgi:hypothetical protein